MISAQITGEGSDLVLLHGVGLDRSMWDRCLPDLAELHRVRALDLPGHGRSGEVPEGVTAGDIADAVQQELPEPVHLVGFSLGALIAQELALRAPSLVRSLTLVSSVAARTQKERGDVLGRLELAATDFEATVEAAVLRWFDESWRRREPALAQRTRSTLLANDREQYLRCYRVFATADASLWPRLGAITAPTLAVTGAQDPGSTPRMARDLAAAIPGARSAVVPETRHLLPLERPDDLVRLILDHVGSVDREHLDTGTDTA
ncbi:pimeloyl-ACP methyl ester carboxylesterase [Spinactinospora alkalitolerans]|uniref:Pimeloyl-ACP methyl ester carboxylesterase n=1 Tax=Spinactinospora alkalitolerans TaxID=687207 RepID=A0A852TVT8_9ACTN|nr:alpha/beta fold hydrolase [Spinactinospora alkalitolerans]NYE47831.1 pimeloyl-ACP methyl ester carboxylesterase [Spinactinospora alkalitolerans]